MGVMSCSRNSCDNIMCNRTINLSGYNYICYECFEELREKQKSNPEINIKDIEKFLDTPSINNDFTQPLIDLDKLCETIR